MEPETICERCEPERFEAVHAPAYREALNAAEALMAIDHEAGVRADWEAARAFHELRVKSLCPRHTKARKTKLAAVKYAISESARIERENVEEEN